MTLKLPWNNFDFKVASLDYPADHTTGIEIELEHVRCVDNIRVSFDFARDGWVIWQPIHGEDIIDEWVEVHFAQAWRLRNE